MLLEIKNYFGTSGTLLTDKKSNVYRLRITGIANSLILKAHFDKYPLFTHKLVYYQLWVEVLNILVKGEDLTLSVL